MQLLSNHIITVIISYSTSVVYFLETIGDNTEKKYKKCFLKSFIIKNTVHKNFSISRHIITIYLEIFKLPEAMSKIIRLLYGWDIVISTLILYTVCEDYVVPHLRYHILSCNIWCQHLNLYHTNVKI